jgi:hypothetical protein
MRNGDISKEGELFKSMGERKSCSSMKKKVKYGIEILNWIILKYSKIYATELKCIQTKMVNQNDYRSNLADRNMREC